MKKKMIVITQKDIKDCGACSLQSLIIYHGGYVPLEKIREDTITNINGTTFYHMAMAARKYGFDAVCKKCLNNELVDIILPAIVHVRYSNGFTHFMVLYEINNKKVVLMDPAQGKVIMLKEQFFKIFTGGIMELFPRSKIMCLQKQNSLYDLFVNIIKLNKKIIILLLISSFGLIIMTLLSGVYFKIGYEMISQNFNLNGIKYVIFIFLLITLLKIVLTHMKGYFENHLDKNLDVKIFDEFITHTFFLPLKVINTRTSGEIITRINEIFSIKSLFTQLFIFAILDVSMALITTIILFYLNGKLALILLSVLVLYILLSIVFSPYIYRKLKINIDKQTNFNANLIESVDMINSIKNLNASDYALSKVEKYACQLIGDNYDLEQQMNTIETGKSLLLEVGVFVINTYGLFMIYSNKFSLVNLVTFNTLMSYLIDPIKNVVNLIPKFNFLRASYNKLCDFINIDEEKVGSSEKFQNGIIELNNVTFSYDAYNNVITNVNLLIKPGEKVMLKGESGCGKSTICQLLQRIHEPTSGKITIEEKNILDYSLNTIRENITYVGQKESLYSDTIINNILLGRKQNEHFDKVCEICQLEKIVAKRPFRYQFGIDANFANISGGEKQRIILARALMKNSEILILDEALSELDYNLERQIIKKLIAAFPLKTVIYVSHKNQDKLFDRVIYLKDINNG